MEDNHNISDFVLDALQDETLRDAPQFVRWMEQDEGNRQLFEDMLCCREAVGRMQAEDGLDMEKQWQRISHGINAGRNVPNRSRARLRWVAVAAAAAVALLLVMVWKNVWTGSETQTLAPAKIAPQVVKADQKDAGQTIIVEAMRRTPPVLLTDGRGQKHVVACQTLAYTAVDEELPPERLILSTPRGRSVKVVLNDSTEVWLNGESRLTYPSCFTGSTRTVRLEGEAYFKVAHNARQPFIVEHGGVTTRVLGTAFNIRSYSGAKKHITLVAGSVEVTDSSLNRHDVLRPGEDLAYTESLVDSEIKAVDTAEYTAWTEGLFCFDNAELTEMMREIGRWYNMTVVFADKEAHRLHFSFWAERNKPVAETVSLLNQIGSVKAVLDSKNRKITIRKR